VIDALFDNHRSRDAILGRVRKALGRDATESRAGAEALAYIAAHATGPRPSLPGDLVARFIGRATDMASTVERIGTSADIPVAVARYLEALQLSPELADQKTRAGVCWPEFGALDWASVGLAIESRPTVGHDRLGITGSFCAIAETGTLVMTTGPDTPTATAMLPDTYVAVVREGRIVSGMEEAFALVRAESGPMPRAIHLISGPSRTGDIEQTIVLGAHGPFRMHILLTP